MSEKVKQQVSSEPAAPSASDNASDIAPSAEYRGERNDSLRAHLRFVWVTLLVACGLLEYGFDKSIVGSFQAMVGFLQVFGYEDPRVPSGWVSCPLLRTQRVSNSFAEHRRSSPADHQLVHASWCFHLLLCRWATWLVLWQKNMHRVWAYLAACFHYDHGHHHVFGATLLLETDDGLWQWSCDYVHHDLRR